MCAKDGDEDMGQQAVNKSTGTSKGWGWLRDREIGSKSKGNGHHKMILLVLMTLACGSKPSGGRKEDDQMRDALKEEGRALRRLLGTDDRFVLTPLALVLMACGGGKGGPSERDREDMPHRGPARDKRPPNPFPFMADAWSILFGPTQGGQFLSKRDVAGWARWVFLDDSVERHPFNCKYVRMLRFIRGLGQVGSVS